MKISDLVLFKDHHYIAFSKPAGLPVQPDPNGEKSLQDLAEIYCHQPLHLIHRLDQPVSGIVLLGKKPESASWLQQHWHSGEVVKTYLAVVSGKMPSDTGEATHYLKANATGNKTKAYDKEQPGTKASTLHWRVLSQGERYQLVEIELSTGRHHQIRAQLGALGCPVKGDVKYGARRSNGDRSIHLHAFTLQFPHPAEKGKILLKAPVPADPLWEKLFSLRENTSEGSVD